MTTTWFLMQKVCIGIRVIIVVIAVDIVVVAVVIIVVAVVAVVVFLRCRFSTNVIDLTAAAKPDAVENWQKICVTPKFARTIEILSSIIKAPI